LGLSRCCRSQGGKHAKLILSCLRAMARFLEVYLGWVFRKPNGPLYMVSGEFMRDFYLLGSYWFLHVVGAVKKSCHGLPSSRAKDGYSPGTSPDPLIIRLRLGLSRNATMKPSGRGLWL
jgi:hypothetical protein